jgi:protein phosphatase
MRFNVGCATDIGRKRSQNQDSVISVPELGLFVVADGMGGHRGGETASRITVETVPEVVRAEKASASFDPREAIKKAIERASHAVHEHATKVPELNGMGTTAVAMLFPTDGDSARLTIGHVGDSRCYYLRDGAIWQVTRDHSLVQEKLRAGLITRAELKTDRMKNVITRSVGFEPNVSVEVYEMDVKPGDTLLLCSDGLSGLVEDTEILKIAQDAREQGKSLQQAVESLIDAANRNGGDDNISTIMVEVAE